MPNLSPNQIFHGRYQLLHVLGRGGFSEVWRAHDRTSQLDLALKVYSGVDAEGINIFRREFQRVFGLNHTHLLKPNNFDVSREGQPYLVMPYCPNGSALKHRGKADEKELARLLAGIGAALAYLHRDEVGIIHQDIKPDNFLINDNGDYLLTDFGISTEVKQRLAAHRQDGQHSLVNDSQIGVTPPAYRGPECFRREFRERLPLAATDIWALGASVYELATGEMPFGEAGGAIQDADSKVPELPGGKRFTLAFRNLLQRCLHYDIAERPTAKELATKAQTYLEEEYWPTLYVPDQEEPAQPAPTPEPDQPEGGWTPNPIYSSPKPKPAPPPKKVDSTRILWIAMSVVFLGLMGLFAQQVYVNFIRGDDLRNPVIKNTPEQSHPPDTSIAISPTDPTSEPGGSSGREGGTSTSPRPIRPQPRIETQPPPTPDPSYSTGEVKVDGPTKLPPGKTETGAKDDAATRSSRANPSVVPRDTSSGTPLESGKGGGGN